MDGGQGRNEFAGSEGEQRSLPVSVVSVHLYLSAVQCGTLR